VIALMRIAPPVAAQPELRPHAQERSPLERRSIASAAITPK
jgi:hypothetical protein